MNKVELNRYAARIRVASKRLEKLNELTDIKATADLANEYLNEIDGCSAAIREAMGLES